MEANPIPSLAASIPNVRYVDFSWQLLPVGMATAATAEVSAIPRVSPSGIISNEVMHNIGSVVKTSAVHGEGHLPKQRATRETDCLSE